MDLVNEMESAYLRHFAKTLDDRESMKVALDIITRHIVKILVRDAIKKVLEEL